MTGSEACQCPSGLPCGRAITQEDLRCDECRGQCIVFGLAAADGPSPGSWVHLAVPTIKWIAERLAR